MLGARGAARGARLCAQSDSLNLGQSLTDESGRRTVFKDAGRLPGVERSSEAPPLGRQAVLLFAEAEAEAPTAPGLGGSLCRARSSPRLALGGRAGHRLPRETSSRRFRLFHFR